MERSDFLIGAFRSGILARSAQRQVLSDLPCLYPFVYILHFVKSRSYTLSSPVLILLIKRSP
nr:MAG TPA: hypothetical protein [Microviridae sp.]